MLQSMKYILIYISIIFATTTFADEKVSSKQDAFSAIDEYRSNLLIEKGYKAGQSVLAFAEETDLVVITIDMKALPWLNKGSVQKDIASMMLLAYIVGSVDAQLKQGKDFNSHCLAVKEVTTLIKLLSKRVDSSQIEPATISLKKAREYGSCK